MIRLAAPDTSGVRERFMAHIDRMAELLHLSKRRK
jgi:hypothetical protein